MCLVVNHDIENPNFITVEFMTAGKIVSEFDAYDNMAMKDFTVYR
jgi:hypothetical protein